MDERAKKLSESLDDVMKVYHGCVVERRVVPDDIRTQFETIMSDLTKLDREECDKGNRNNDFIRVINNPFTFTYTHGDKLLAEQFSYDALSFMMVHYFKEESIFLLGNTDIGVKSYYKKFKQNLRTKTIFSSEEKLPIEILFRNNKLYDNKEYGKEYLEVAKDIVHKYLDELYDNFSAKDLYREVLDALGRILNDYNSSDTSPTRINKELYDLFISHPLYTREFELRRSLRAAEATPPAPASTPTSRDDRDRVDPLRILKERAEQKDPAKPTYGPRLFFISLPMIVGATACAAVTIANIYTSFIPHLFNRPDLGLVNLGITSMAIDILVPLAATFVMMAIGGALLTASGAILYKERNQEYYTPRSKEHEKGNMGNPLPVAVKVDALNPTPDAEKSKSPEKEVLRKPQTEVASMPVDLGDLEAKKIASYRRRKPQEVFELSDIDFAFAETTEGKAPSSRVRSKAKHKRVKHVNFDPTPCKIT